MRIHIIAPGFTPEVFIKAMAVMAKTGVDKLVSIHTFYQNKNVEAKVESTIKTVEDTLRIKAEKNTLHGDKFTDLVREIGNLINKYGDYDEIYLHLEGGERHVGLAMAYASFFTKKNVRLIFATEYGSEEKNYEFEMMPPLPSYELSDSQKEVLRLVAAKDKQNLKELASRVKPSDPASAAPGILRHLKKLSELHLIEVDLTERKEYTISPAGKLFL